MTVAAARNPFDEFLALYQAQPVAFVTEVVGAKPDVWQTNVLETYGRILRGETPIRKLSIRSCHGPGKTAVVAWIALHHLIMFFPQRTAVTAPSAKTAFDNFYNELCFWLGKCPQSVRDLVTVKADTIELAGRPRDSFLTVRTARAETPEALQGIHCEAGRVLLLVDEASGVPEKVYEAGDGSMSGANAITILISNPTRTTGTFYESHHALKHQYHTFHVSWQDSPRVDPRYEQEMREHYGGDSNVYKVRVLGEFATEDRDVIIPQELVLAAVERDVKDNPFRATVWGVDVARSGKDRSALCKRRGSVVPEPVKTWHIDDLMVLSGKLMDEYRNTPPSQRPVDILVDAIGLGAGVVDRLREIGAPARAVNVSETPSFDGGGRYHRLRDELWFKAKAWFYERTGKLPEDAQLIRELSLPQQEFTSDGLKVKVESKDKTRARNHGRSPDVADAFVLTFASDAANVVSPGSAASGQPLRRNLTGIV